VLTDPNWVGSQKPLCRLTGSPDRGWVGSDRPELSQLAVGILVPADGKVHGLTFGPYFSGSDSSNFLTNSVA
jgi:hypothetical protein